MTNSPEALAAAAAQSVRGARPKASGKAQKEIARWRLRKKSRESKRSGSPACSCCSILRAGQWPRGRMRAAQAQAAGAARALTVERIYSAPSLSGRVLRDTVWSPDGKWLSLSEPTRPIRAARKSGPWTPPPASASVLVDADHLRNVLLPPASRGQTDRPGPLTPCRDISGRRTAKRSCSSPREELFWYDLATQNLARPCHGSEPAPGSEEPDETTPPLTTPRFRPTAAGSASCARTTSGS